MSLTIISPGEILMEIQHTNLLKHPKKIRTNLDKRDKDCYCMYHQDHGQFTGECNQLKDDIEALIVMGKKRNVRKDRKWVNNNLILGIKYGEGGWFN